LLFPGEAAGQRNVKGSWASTTTSAIAELERFRAGRVLAINVWSGNVTGIGADSLVGLNAHLEPVVLPATRYREHTGISTLALFIAMYRLAFWPTSGRPPIAQEYGSLAEAAEWLEEVRAACDEAAAWMADDVLTVTSSVQATELLERIEELLNLPLWRQRSLLYEVWALCATLEACEQAGWTAELRGLAETNGTWVLSVGPARDPVATLHNVFHDDISLDVWREPSRATATGQYTPDVTVSTPPPFARDLLIVEAKDRTKMQAGHHRAKDHWDQAPGERTARPRDSGAPAPSASSRPQ
jgi:hypothetical protein